MRHEQETSLHIGEMKMHAIGDGDDIFAVLCEGHVDAETFNKGYDLMFEGDPLDQSELHQEYWKRTKVESPDDGLMDWWLKCEATDDGAKPMTVNYW